jgi:hypothetical protein
MQIQQHLTAPTARREQPSSSMTHRHHRHQWTCASCGCCTQHHQLGTWSPIEVRDIHPGMYPPQGVHRCGGHGMVLINSQPLYKLLGCIQHTLFIRVKHRHVRITPPAFTLG